MASEVAYGLTAVTLLFAAPLVAQTEIPDSLALGRKFTGWMVDGHADSLWNTMDEATRRRIGSLEIIGNMVDHMYEEIGEETAVVSETARLLDDGVWEYRRVSEFDAAPERMVWTWRSGKEGQIVGVSIRDESEPPPAN
jgi:hypothetical protein